MSMWVLIFWALACLLLSACAHTPQAPTDLKRCAAALVTLKASADCTALSPNVCMFTMADIERSQSAAADKQNYCPRLAPGQEEAND